MTTEYPTSFWIDDETKEILQKLSSETGLSRSAIVREAVKSMHTDKKMSRVRKLVDELHKVVTGG